MKIVLVVLSVTILFCFSVTKAIGQSNQIVANGAITSQVTFPGSGCTYSWTNSNTSIGLPASGTGNIASFKAINTGNTPVTATITATPIPVAFAYITGLLLNVTVINTITNSVVTTIPISTSGSFGETVSPNDSTVYIINSINNDRFNTLSVINTISNTLVTTIQLGSGGSIAVAASPDGSKVYVTNQNLGTISIINTATNTIAATIPAGLSPGGIVVSPDGSRIYVSSSALNQITVINTATNAIAAVIPTGTPGNGLYGAGGVSLSPNGKWLYAIINGSNNICVISTASNTVVATIPVGTTPFEICVSPDGNFIYVTNSGSNSVSVIDSLTNSVIATIPVGTDPIGISATSDGKFVYVANSEDGTISVINTATNMVVNIIKTGGGPISFGNFMVKPIGCNSAPVTFTITVNPTLPGITIENGITGTISACAGTASAPPQIQQFTLSGKDLMSGITATAPAGFEVSLLPGSGYVNSVTIPETNDSIGNTIVYIRASASAPIGNNSGNVVLSSAGVSNQTVLATETINPVIYPTIQISASGNNICAGADVNFTATTTDGGNAPVYQWTLNGTPIGSNSPKYHSDSLKNGDLVACILTSNETCAVPDTSMEVNMVIYPLPSVTFQPDTVYVLNNNPVQLNPIITGLISQYSWSPAAGLDNTTIQYPYANPSSISIYQLVVNTSFGCTATDKITVIAGRPLEIPNAFTPNGDGHNDVFRIPPGVPFNMQDFEIFDRWGKRIFHTQNIIQGWDGTYHGIPTDMGTYTYIITGKSASGVPVTLKGTVVLIR